MSYDEPNHQEVHEAEPFTDDRLRILKNIELRQTAQIILSHTEVEALLARLEAAEDVCQSVIDNGDEGNFKFSMKAWLASKGNASVKS